MPFAILVVLIGLVVSVFLSFVVAAGWVRIREQSLGSCYLGLATDVNKAWAVFFGLGMVVTAGILAVFWMTGVDLGRML